VHVSRGRHPRVLRSKDALIKRWRTSPYRLQKACETGQGYSRELPVLGHIIPDVASLARNRIVGTDSKHKPTDFFAFSLFYLNFVKS
ncbi:hypothetical protein, partial [Hallella bergensis]|uniref:hypothetical protein n=1 Tax=Hallella bergensis TaxID=242750 RepID=UPI0023F0051A